MSSNNDVINVLNIFGAQGIMVKSSQNQVRPPLAESSIFTRNYNVIFRNYCVAITRKNATRLQGVLPEFADKKLAENSEFSIFRKVLHCRLKTCYTQICKCDGMAIISCNRIAIASKNCTSSLNFIKNCVH